MDSKEISVGSEVWSQADLYTKIKVLKHLIALDVYCDIALYGSADFEEEFMLDESQRVLRRYNSLKRISSTIRQLLGNSLFVIKESFNSQTKVKEWIEQVERLMPYIDKTLTTKDNFITHEREFIIREELFKKLYNILQDIKDELNFPLNQSGLIFRSSDEFDLDKIMKDIALGG